MRFVRKFCIADTHFNHLNIINLCKRPFSSVDQMNEHLIAEWYSVVSDEDIVCHLGDFGFGSEQSLSTIFARLKGRKKLILGNHDMLRNRVKDTILALPWDSPPVISLNTTDSGRRIFLSHYAYRV